MGRYGGAFNLEPDLSEPVMKAIYQWFKERDAWWKFGTLCVFYGLIVWLISGDPHQPYTMIGVFAFLASALTRKE